MSQNGRNAPGQTLQATALIHEAWLRLTGVQQHRVERTHPFLQRRQPKLWRRILIDNAAANKPSRHGGIWRDGRGGSRNCFTDAPTMIAGTDEGHWNRLTAFNPRAA